MDSQQPVKPRFKLSITTLIWIAVLGFLAYRLIAGSAPAVPVIPYSVFKTDVNSGKISSVLVTDTDISGKMNDGTAFTTVRVDDPDLTKTLEANQVEITGQAPSTGGGIVGFLLTWILPLALMVGLWYWFFGRNRGGANSMGSIFSFGKSKARENGRTNRRDLSRRRRRRRGHHRFERGD